MSADSQSVALAAVLDTVSLLRGEVATFIRSNARMEASHRDLHYRLDRINAAQAAVTDIVPLLELIAAKTIEGNEATETRLGSVSTALIAIAEKSDRDRQELDAARREILSGIEASTGAATRAIVADVLPALEILLGQIRSNHVAARDVSATMLDGVASIRDDAAGIAILADKLLEGASADRKQRAHDQEKTAGLIAFTRSAALGHRDPLPVAVEDDTTLERFVLNQPADLVSTERALVDWRTIVANANTEDLITHLRKQQAPSPTDIPHTRVLRYRLAAITRAQIEGRGAMPPGRPTTTRSTDRSEASCTRRSQELADLWRAGESNAIYADPELAGAIDIFAAAERRFGPPVDGGVPPELVALHRNLADRIESGDRPMSNDRRPASGYERSNAVEPGKDRLM